jgi:hypothetical protein
MPLAAAELHSSSLLLARDPAMFSRLLTNLDRSRKLNQRRPSAHARMTFETLENRIVMSANAGALPEVAGATTVAVAPQLPPSPFALRLRRIGQDGPHRGRLRRQLGFRLRRRQGDRQRVRRRADGER